MVTKLVVGLTDVLHNDFVIEEETPSNLFDSHTIVSVDSYIITTPPTLVYPTSISITENEKLEWVLDTTLPGVVSLLSTVEQMKTRPLLREATIIKRMPIDGYNSFSLFFGLVNYVTNPAVVYTEFTDEDYNSLAQYPRFGDVVLAEVDGYEINGVSHTSSITYAVDQDTTDYLANAYPPRSAVPMFNVRFIIDEQNNVPQRTNPIKLDNWLNSKIDALTAKGWELNNPKSRVGFYVAGSLVGDPWEQYLKFANNPYICTINIVEE